MSKKYPLDVWPLQEEGGGTTAYFTKGHYSAEEFVRDMEEQFEFSPSNPEKIERGYMRRIPHKFYDSGVLDFPVPKGRGAFPVTYIMIDHI